MFAVFFLKKKKISVNHLTKTWIQQQDESTRPELEVLVNDYFYRALEWTLQTNAFVVSTTKVGQVKTALSQVRNPTTTPMGSTHNNSKSHGAITIKSYFVNQLVKGLGANLPLALRQELATMVYGWANERIPTPQVMQFVFIFFYFYDELQHIFFNNHEMTRLLSIAILTFLHFHGKYMSHKIRMLFRQNFYNVAIHLLSELILS